MAIADENALPSVWGYRLTKAEAAVEDLDKSKADKEYVDAIASEVRGLKKAVVSLLFGIVTSAVMVCFTLLVTVGSHLS